jgi:hypothetical protein
VLEDMLRVLVVLGHVSVQRELDRHFDHRDGGHACTVVFRELACDSHGLLRVLGIHERNENVPVRDAGPRRRRKWLTYANCHAVHGRSTPLSAESKF